MDPRDEAASETEVEIGRKLAKARTIHQRNPPPFVCNIGTLNGLSLSLL
ncbi:MAG TPA: hypothetical protein VFY55_05710 [Nitrososphaeraceae archaeon]|nr:hypothetical protein [Nitrososphaeraceae archaeon]